MSTSSIALSFVRQWPPRADQNDSPHSTIQVMARIDSMFESSSPLNAFNTQDRVIDSPAESPMKRSTDRILTTHTGSLIRTTRILQGMKALAFKQPYDLTQLERDVEAGIQEVVR